MEYELWLNYFIYAGIILQCFILFVILAFKLWDLPVRVNCWFCNTNDWIQFSQRNSWICQNCQQYNGFTSGGDYNKSLQTHLKNPVYFNHNRHSPRSHHNGLCHKCNTNQQLKILQLANFKPLNERNFDHEVEAFNVHLDDVYKLCHDCRRLVNKKLQSEKGHFLIKKKNPSQVKKMTFSSILIASKRGVTIILKVSAILLLLCIFVDIVMNADVFLSKKMVRTMKQHYRNVGDVFNSSRIINDDVMISISNMKEILNNMTAYVHMAKYIDSENLTAESIKSMVINSPLGRLTLIYFLQMLTTEGVILQGILFISELGLSMRHFINLVIWSISYYISVTEDKYLHIFQIICAGILIMNTPLKSSNTNGNKKEKNAAVKKMKNLSSSTFASSYNETNLISDDSDSDISHGRMSELDNLKTQQPSYPNYFANNRQCSEQKTLNKLFPSMQGAESIKSPSTYLPINRSFSPEINLWQRNIPSHDSDLNESISTLNLGNQNNSSNKNSFVFSTKRYNSQNVFMRSPPSTVRRPVLSPSRLTPGTQHSWVAGGYWGVDSPKQIYNIHDNSRSSSQSSGFESLSSGYRIGSSFPLSKDESKAGENCKKSDGFCDRSVYSSHSKNQSAFQSFSSQASTIQPSITSRKPLVFPRSLPYYYSMPWNNLNLLNPSFSTPNTERSFRPLESPNSNYNGDPNNTFS